MSPISIVWLLLSAFGLWVSIRNLRAVLNDREIAEDIDNHRRIARLVTVEASVTRAWIRVGTFGWWTLIGIVFGFFRPPAPIGFYGLLGLLVTVGALAVSGVLDERERAKLDKLLADDIAKGS